MPIIAPTKPKIEKKLPPEGPTIGRCYSVIYMGTIDSSYQGKPRKKARLRITFELPEHMDVFNPERGQEPFVVSRNFTFTMQEKGHLRPFLEAWRGKKFTDEEAAAFDIAKLAGQPAMLTIAHQKSEDGQTTYANITSVSPIHKSMLAQVPPQLNQSVVYNVAEHDSRAYSFLPDWMKDEIAKSDEWKAMGAATQEPPPPPPPPPAPRPQVQQQRPVAPTPQPQRQPHPTATQPRTPTPQTAEAFDTNEQSPFNNTDDCPF